MTSRRFPLRKLFGRRQPVVLLVVVLIALAAQRWWPSRDQPSEEEVPPTGTSRQGEERRQHDSRQPPEFLEERAYQVKRVVDGDTLLLANGARVRLIGADTPETVKPNHPIEFCGPEATDFTERFVAGGEVRLEFDGPRQDKYRRFLAHVWVGEKMLGEELVRAGLARAKTHYRYSEEAKARLRNAEAAARAADRGIWSR